MDRLPVELLGLIAHGLDFHDGLSFRATCRKFDAIITPRLFSQFTVSHLPSEFDYLRRVSTVPVFSNHILEFSYCGLVYESADRYKWEQNIRWPSGVEAPDHPVLPPKPTQEDALNFASAVEYWATQVCVPANHYSSADLDAGWEAFCGMNRDAQRLNALYMTSSLTASFMRFSNLKSLAIHTNDGRACKCNSSIYSSLIFTANLVAPGRLTGSDIHAAREVGLLQVESVMHSVSAANIRLESLWIDILYCRFNPTTLEVNLPLDPTEYIDVLLNLKSLSLMILLDLTQEVMDPPGTCLTRLLSFAPSLEKLKLHMAAFVPETHKEILVCPSVIPQCTNLKELDLSGFDCTADVLVACLEKFSKRLKTLKLAYMELTKGTWEETFPRLKKLLQLNDFKVKGSFGSNDAGEENDLHMSQGWKETDTSLGQAMALWFLFDGPYPLAKGESSAM